MNMSNAIVGAGIIGMPFALKLAGFGFGIVLLVSMAFITQYSISCLVGGGIAVRARSFESTANRALGPWGERAVLAAQFAFDYGAGLSYLIITGDTSTQVVASVLGREFEGLRQLCIAAIAFVTMLPLCLMRDIAMLETFSSLSIATVVVVLGLLVFKLFDRHSHGSAPLLDGATFISATPLDAVVSVGVFSFAFVCNDCIFLYYNSLKHGSLGRFQKVVAAALVGSGTLTAALGCVGFLSFGADTQDNILNNFADDDGVATLMRALYVATMVLTYPICTFVTRQVMHALVEDLAGTARTEVGSVSQRRHVAYTLAIFLTNVAIVMVVADLGSVMSLTGNVAGSFLGYILPGLIALAPAVQARQSQDRDGAWLADEAAGGGREAGASCGSAVGQLSLVDPRRRGPTLLVAFGAAAAVLGIVTAVV